MQPVLDVRSLSISFRQYGRGLRQTQLHTIKDLSLDILQGEMVAVVGASGSGKSLLAQAILGILPYNASMGGDMFYMGQPLDEKRIRRLRGKEIFMVPQSISYLDPLMKVGGQLTEGHRDRETAATHVLASYGLGEDVKRMYPFQLSGGMARRVLISTAVMGNPKLVVADEPTPGLHAGVARRVMGHFREIADGGSAVLLITHDLELAIEFAQRIVVFYAGVTVEQAAATDFANGKLRHPYTRALWDALPSNGFNALPGANYIRQAQGGCPFAPRCQMADSSCRRQVPYREWNGGQVRCAHMEGL